MSNPGKGDTPAPGSATDLEQGFALLEAAMEAVSKTTGLFQSGEFRQRRAQALEAYCSIEPIAGEYLEALRGRPVGDAAQAGGRFQRAMCFPARFLGIGKSIDGLGAGSAAKVDEMLRLALHLGLAYHFSLHECPARDRHAAVDAGVVARWFYPEAPEASARLKEYDGSTGGLPSRMFGWFYRRNSLPVLRDVLRLGLWKRIQGRAYLKNLMFSGILLGMAFDMAAQNKL
jgi:hypothetical protein